jgi:ABC-type uncharacterized transport system ATPase subunit
VLDPLARVESLSVGGQQRLEIVKALARDARTLILDEPTAVLAPAEGKELLGWLRAFADQGNGVVLITHKLADALAIADAITVLRRGRVVLDAPTADVTARGVTSAILGDEAISVPHVATARRAGEGDVVVSAQHADLIDARGVITLRDVDFEVRGGEIVGVAGVEGAGQRELLRVLAMRARPYRGEVRTPPTAGFVPEDRHRDALVLGFTPAENVALKGAGARRGLVRWREFERLTQTLIRQFDVRGAARSVRMLSGGNQQKLILSRELNGSPPLLVVENPTRGLDIRASQTVHDRLRAVAESGAAVVVYSSDPDEVLELATRILVLHAGSVRACALDRDAVGRAMLGVA